VRRWSAKRGGHVLQIHCVVVEDGDESGGRLNPQHTKTCAWGSGRGLIHQHALVRCFPRSQRRDLGHPRFVQIGARVVEGYLDSRDLGGRAQRHGCGGRHFFLSPIAFGVAGERRVEVPEVIPGRGVRWFPTTSRAWMRHPGYSASLPQFGVFRIVLCAAFFDWGSRSDLAVSSEKKLAKEAQRTHRRKHYPRCRPRPGRAANS
jgi:hypothetical protein